jgi:hypothetical protein
MPPEAVEFDEKKIRCRIVSEDFLTMQRARKDATQQFSDLLRLIIGVHGNFMFEDQPLVALLSNIHRDLAECTHNAESYTEH